MAEFKSYKSYGDFARRISTQRRYWQNAEQTDFLQTVLATREHRQKTIDAGTILWRAQLGHDWRVDGEDEGVPDQCHAAFGPERMKPLTYKAREGRANPTGIPFLYLATHREIAVAEVRPWMWSYVSLGQFRLEHDVRIIDCVTDDHRLMLYSPGYEPEPEERERAVWRDIDRAFSQPVTFDDNIASYAATQSLAEFFRDSGLDGIAYGSAMAEGHTVALFDVDAAALVNCVLVQIRRVKLDFDIADNPYSIELAPKTDTEKT